MYLMQSVICSYRKRLQSQVLAVRYRDEDEWKEPSWNPLYAI